MTSATRHLLGAAMLLATGALAACGPVNGNPASGGASGPPSGGAAASSAPASPASSPAASGGQLGNAATRNPAAPPAMVTLAPGGVAHAVLQVAEAGNYSQSACTPVTAHWLRIFPPNQATAIYAHYEVQACSAKLPAKLGSQLAVYVVRPGEGK